MHFHLNTFNIWSKIINFKQYTFLTFIEYGLIQCLPFLPIIKLTFHFKRIQYLMSDNFSSLPVYHISLFLPKASLIKFSSSSSSAASNKGENAYLTTKEVTENKSSLTGKYKDNYKFIYKFNFCRHNCIRSLTSPMIDFNAVLKKGNNSILSSGGVMKS